MSRIEFSEIKELYPFRSNYFNIKGHKYHYLDEGAGSPVVMLHGNPTWSFFFREMITELSPRYRVIVPDHLGCGLSDKPQDFEYRLETHIDNLENLLLTLNLENITLVMHDWGGAIGMGFATRHPQRIKSLIILNSGAFSCEHIPFRIALCRIPCLGNMLIRRFNLFSSSAIHMAVTQRMPLEVQKGYLYPYQSYDDRVAVQKFVEDIPMSPLHRSYEVLLQIEHGLWMFRENPVCMIWGMKDWCFTPHFLERWALYYPQAYIHCMNDAGHYLVEDAGPEVMSCVNDFLETNKI